MTSLDEQVKLMVSTAGGSVEQFGYLEMFILHCWVN